MKYGNRFVYLNCEFVMNKEILRMLCENMANVESQIEEMSHQLQGLYFQLRSIKQGIEAELDDDQDVIESVMNGSVKAMNETPESVSPAPVNHSVDVREPVVESSAVVEHNACTSEMPKQEVVQNVQSVPECEPMSECAPIQVRYCSIAISNELEFSDTELNRTNRSIYVIEIMSETTARFYPIAEQAERLLMKRAELIDPICETNYELTPSDLRITPNAYGLMERNKYGRWNIVKRCSLKH